MHGRACVRVHVQALPTVHGEVHSVRQLRQNLLVVTLLLHVINTFIIMQLSGFLLPLMGPDSVQFIAMLLL